MAMPRSQNKVWLRSVRRAGILLKAILVLLGFATIFLWMRGGRGDSFRRARVWHDQSGIYAAISELSSRWGNVTLHLDTGTKWEVRTIEQLQDALAARGYSATWGWDSGPGAFRYPWYDVNLYQAGPVRWDVQRDEYSNSGHVLVTVIVPDGLLVLLFWIWPGLSVLFAARRAALRAYRGRLGLCVDCGYDLRASPERCPECGRMVGITSPRQTCSTAQAAQ